MENGLYQIRIIEVDAVRPVARVDLTVLLRSVIKAVFAEGPEGVQIRLRSVPWRSSHFITLRYPVDPSTLTRAEALIRRLLKDCERTCEEQTKGLGAVGEVPATWPDYSDLVSYLWTT